MAACVRWRSRRSRLRRGPAKILRGGVDMALRNENFFTPIQSYNVRMLHSNLNSRTRDCADLIFFVMPEFSRKTPPGCGVLSIPVNGVIGERNEQSDQP